MRNTSKLLMRYNFPSLYLKSSIAESKYGFKNTSILYLLLNCIMGFKNLTKKNPDNKLAKNNENYKTVCNFLKAMIEFYKNKDEQKNIAAIYAECIDFILTVDQNIGDHTQLFEIFDNKIMSKEYELVFAAYQECIKKADRSSNELIKPELQEIYTLMK